MCRDYEVVIMANVSLISPYMSGRLFHEHNRSGNQCFEMYSLDSAFSYVEICITVIILQAFKYFHKLCASIYLGRRIKGREVRNEYSIEANSLIIIQPFVSHTR